MANRRGYTKNDPIDLDAIPDDRKYVPAPRVPNIRRPARPSNPPPVGVEVISLSDDEYGGAEDVQEAAPSAWVAVQNRRQSNHLPLDIDKGSAASPSRGTGFGVVARAPSAKPILPGHRSIHSNDEPITAVVADKENREFARPNGFPPNEQQAATTSANIARHVNPGPFAFGLTMKADPKTSDSSKGLAWGEDAREGLDTGRSEGARPVELPETRTVTPISGPTSTFQRSPTTRQSCPEHLTIGTKTTNESKPNRLFSNHLSTLAPPTNLGPADSFQNQPPAFAIPTRNAATVAPPVQKPAAPAPISPKLGVITKMASATSPTAGLNQGPDMANGEITKHHREPTTISRMNTPPAMEVVLTRNESIKKSDSTSPMPVESRSMQASKPKQKAVKSVRSREDGGSRAQFPLTKHNRYPVKPPVPPSRLQELAGPQESPARSEPSMKRSRSREASANINAVAKSDTTVRLIARNMVSESPPVVTTHDEQDDNLPSSIDDMCRPPATVTVPSVQTSSATFRHSQPPQAPNSEAVARPSLAELGNSSPGIAQVEGLISSNSTSDLSAVAGRQSILSDDIETMCSEVEDRLKYILGERQKAHANLAEVRMKCQRTCQERELRTERRQRKGPLPPILPNKYFQSTSPFESMLATQLPFGKDSRSGRLPDISQEVFTKAKPKDIINRSAWVVSTTKYKSGAVCIPSFKEYVSLTDNILADNESKLLATPYFQDEDDKSRKKLLKALPHCYEMKHDEKGPLDLRAEQCRFYKDSIDAFLCKIDLLWDDVLYWLLAPNELITALNDGRSGGSHFESLLLERSKYTTEVFKRDEEAKTALLFQRNSGEWKDFFSHLKVPTAKHLRLSAVACAAVLKECDFSLWYLAQQSETILKHVSRKIKAPTAASVFTYRAAVCRVCHQHNCMIHGELRETPEDSWAPHTQSHVVQDGVQDYETYEDQDSSSESESSRHDSDEKDDGESSDEGEDDNSDEEDDSVPAHCDSDSDIEKMINYKLPANADAFGDYTESEMIESKGSKPPKGKFNSQWWRTHSYTHVWEKRKPFYPCSHEGSCEDALCRCFRENINCEKTCRCLRSCERRFPGCSCVSTPGKRICSSSSCLCNKFRRECDADICGTCGATEILDPVNRYNEDMMGGRCCNVAIQRGVPRKTLLGHSEVHGFGLYMGEDIKKDEYIGEYLGETISVEEGARRLTIYEYQQTMYLFSLNSKQDVDATYMGNKIRFINNAHEKLTNCYAKNFFCNTVFRLALYASKDLKAGTELFFNYNYPKELTVHFKQPKDSVVAVKQIAKSTKQTKQKTKNRASPDLDPEQRRSDEKRRAFMGEILKKARAEKARRLAARKAEQALQDSAANGLSGPQRARKTALNKQYERLQELKPGGKGVKSVRRSSSRDHADASYTRIEADKSSDSSADSRDTEEHDDVPLSDEDRAVAKAENGINRPKRSKAKKRPSIAPVVAVKAIHRGVRSGSGRKRKRPVVFNSEDE